MDRATFLLTMIAAIAAPAAAGSVGGQSPPSSQPPKAADKVVCRFINTTGSRLHQERECKRQADWDRLSDETMDDLDSERNRATGVPIDPSTGQVTAPH
jgi:hypothetical protein